MSFPWPRLGVFHGVHSHVTLMLRLQRPGKGRDGHPPAFPPHLDIPAPGVTPLLHVTSATACDDQTP